MKVKISNNQSVSDIAGAMLVAIHNSKKIAVKNKFSTDFNKLCKELFDYCLKNFQYIEESADSQTVKQINRFYLDRFGDCKHFSIYIASYLLSKGYNVILRFISQNKFDTKPTHVYCVALNNKKEIYLDCVYGVYDQEPPYYYKKDILLINSTKK